MAASHYNLDNLCAILDYNHLQIDGNIEDVISPEPFMSKFALEEMEFIKGKQSFNKLLVVRKIKIS